MKFNEKTDYIMSQVEHNHEITSNGFKATMSYNFLFNY